MMQDKQNQLIERISDLYLGVERRFYVSRGKYNKKTPIRPLRINLMGI